MTPMIRKRFLVVDDDPDLRGLLQVYLERDGYAVESAGNGREALTKLDHANYDAVLLDNRMPEVNGLAVLSHIRQHHPSLPVVMMTGDQRSQVAAESLAAMGARACLFKPFRRQELQQVLTCWFETAA